MIENKKGLSAIIGTLLIILLVIVAVGIIWVVIRGTLEGGVEDLDIGAKCLDSSIKVTAADCSGATCLVTVQRETGADAIDGIRAIVSDGSASEYFDREGNLEALGIATLTVAKPALLPITSAEAAIYFTNSAGEKQLCAGSHELTAGILNAP